jgi:hypothetical protein
VCDDISVLYIVENDRTVMFKTFLVEMHYIFYMLILTYYINIVCHHLILGFESSSIDHIYSVIDLKVPFDK